MEVAHAINEEAKRRRSGGVRGGAAGGAAGPGPVAAAYHAAGP